MENLFFVFHSLVDHHLNPTFGDLKRFDQGGVLGNANRSLGLHFGRPIREGEGLVRRQGSDVNFYDSTLKDVFPELIEHLSLGGVNDVAEVDVILQFPLEGDLD